jgi:hypothetical protein
LNGFFDGCALDSTGIQPVSSLLKKGTGSERMLDIAENFGLPRGACPLFQHPVRCKLWAALASERLYRGIMLGDRD